MVTVWGGGKEREGGGGGGTGGGGGGGGGEVSPGPAPGSTDGGPSSPLKTDPHHG